MCYTINMEDRMKAPVVQRTEHLAANLEMQVRILSGANDYIIIHAFVNVKEKM